MGCSSACYSSALVVSAWCCDKWLNTRYAHRRDIAELIAEVEELRKMQRDAAEKTRAVLKGLKHLRHQTRQEVPTWNDIRGR